MRLEEIIRNQFLQHLIFWGVSYVILLRLFAYEEQLYASDYIYSFLFHLSLLLVVYANLRLLIPQFLEKKRYIIFIISLLILFCFGILLNELTFNHLSDWLFPDYYFISYYTYFEIGQFIGSYLVISMLFKFSKAWFEINEKEQLINKLAKEKMESELEGLKAQVQPHFLFNNLNSIYALAIDQDERTPDVILALSDNLRYILYECIQPKVPLSKEIEFIERFLKLQKLRLAEEQAVQWNIIGNVEHKTLAPLLFLPFLENAFKHGKASTQHPVKIQLLAENEKISFSIQNQIRRKDDNLPENEGGIGLSNIKKRLAILYPEKYELKIQEDNNNNFIVHLSITI
jgi:sensor histidine kinase YesM